MNPLAIRLRNARSFEEIVLELPEGLLAILGDNGAGKSTLIAAIDVALFGPETGRSLAPWYPRWAVGEPLLIELLFEHGQDVYRVRRTFNPKGRGTSKLDLERALEQGDDWEPITLESQTATQERLEELIGLSRQTFKASSYLAQGDTGAFCEAVPSARKQILADVVGLQEWDVWLRRARDLRRQVELRGSELRALLERAADELAGREERARELSLLESRQQSQRRDLKDLLKDLKAARERLAEARAQGERRQVAEKALARADADADELADAAEGRAREVIGLKERLEAREELAAIAARLPFIEEERESIRVATEQWQERVRLLIQRRDWDIVAIEAIDEAKRLEERAGEVLAHVGEEHCDRCGQVLGADAAKRAAQSYRDDADKQYQRASGAQENRALVQASIDELPNEEPDGARFHELHGQMKEAVEAERKLAALDEAAARLKVAEAELRVMEKDMPIREQAIATAKKALAAFGPDDPGALLAAENAVTAAEAQESALRSRIETAASTIATYEERLARLDKVASDAAAHGLERDELLKKHDLYAALERACGANGVPALILETVAIPQIEAEASRILALLGGPAYAAELRTLRETKTGELSDTLDVVLLTETGEAPYEAFSGGERARIAFALRLALAQLLASRRGARTGLLVIDEMAGLDARGVAALVQVLENLQAHIPRIIAVSHQAELRDAFTQTLLLENVDGRSRIVA